MALTAFQDVSEDALLIVSSRAVPTLVAELILTFLDASARAIGHRTDGARMLETHLDLLSNEAGQGTAYSPGGRQLWVFLGLIGPWGRLRLVLLQLRRHAL
jgi:hypothetical protein